MKMINRELCLFSQIQANALTAPPVTLIYATGL